MNRILILIFLFLYSFGFSQEDFQKYREDQIYFSLYYNSLGSELDNFKEKKIIVASNLIESITKACEIENYKVLKTFEGKDFKPNHQKTKYRDGRLKLKLTLKDLVNRIG